MDIGSPTGGDRRAELPDDLGALVDAAQVTLVDALRRAALPPRYAALVAAGDLDLGEADKHHRHTVRSTPGAAPRSPQWPGVGVVSAVY